MCQLPVAHSAIELFRISVHVVMCCIAYALQGNLSRSRWWAMEKKMHLVSVCVSRFTEQSFRWKTHSSTPDCICQTNDRYHQCTTSSSLPMRWTRNVNINNSLIEFIANVAASFCTFIDKHTHTAGCRKPSKLSCFCLKGTHTHTHAGCGHGAILSGLISIVAYAICNWKMCN